MQDDVHMITITNRSKEVKTAFVFGFCEFRTTPNYGSDFDVQVECITGGVKYDQLFTESGLFPFYVAKMRVQSASEKQRMKVILLRHSSASGTYMQKPLKPSEHVKEDDFDKTMIDMDVQFEVNGKVRLECKIEPESTVTLQFFTAPNPNK